MKFQWLNESEIKTTGDPGGSIGPSMVGRMSSMADGNQKIGLPVATVFPVLLIVLKKWGKTSK